MKVVTLNLPDPVWGRLASAAEERETTVASLIESGIRSILTPSARIHINALARRLAVTTLVRDGMPDAVICERLGESRSYVSDVRRAAGLKPNRQRRTDTETRSTK